MSDNGFWSEREKAGLRDLANRKDGHRVIRLLLEYFSLPRDEQPEYYKGELKKKHDRLYKCKPELTRDVTVLLLQKVEEHGYEKAKEKVEEVIGGGKVSAATAGR